MRDAIFISVAAQCRSPTSIANVTSCTVTVGTREVRADTTTAFAGEPHPSSAHTISAPIMSLSVDLKNAPTIG
jgi:hypothetical protein